MGHIRFRRVACRSYTYSGVAWAQETGVMGITESAITLYYADELKGSLNVI